MRDAITQERRDQELQRMLDERDMAIRRLTQLLKAQRNLVEDTDRIIHDLNEELNVWEHLADLQRRREQPWIERWHQETGNHDSLPDYGDILLWIIEKAEAAERSVAQRERA